jgi:hypothetical protein
LLSSLSQGLEIDHINLIKTLYQAYI